MNYWDSSALIPLLVHESSSRDIREILASDPAVCTWWGSSLECMSAFARLEREGHMPRSDVTVVSKSLRLAAESWTEIPATVTLRTEALRLLRVHALRATDALHLGAAIIASDHDPAAIDFVTLDHRLADAAEAQGFAVRGPR